MTVDDLAELAMEIEHEDPIDWGMLAISEKEAYTLMASSVIEKYLPLANEDYATTIYLATIVKLTVENFVLNLKLLQKSKND